MLKLNLGSGAHPLPGFVNLDLPAWEWSHGLLWLDDNSVDGITISHSLMYAAEVRWPFIFAELWRVLKTGGVVRITEDATDDPASERFGGYIDRVTLTSVSKVQDYLLRAGFDTCVYGPTLREIQTSTWFTDKSLIQQWHGAPPKVFHIEGRK